jgi:hypothetical protein
MMRALRAFFLKGTGSRPSPGTCEWSSRFQMRWWVWLGPSLSLRAFVARIGPLDQFVRYADRASPPPSRREDAAIHLPHSSSGGGNSPSSRQSAVLPPSVRSTGGGGSLGVSRARRRGWLSCLAGQRLFPDGCRSSLGAEQPASVVWHSRRDGGGSSGALRRRSARASQMRAAQLSAKAEEAAGCLIQFARVCAVSCGVE